MSISDRGATATSAQALGVAALAGVSLFGANEVTVKVANLEDLDVSWIVEETSLSASV